MSERDSGKAMPRLMGWLARRFAWVRRWWSALWQSVSRLGRRRSLLAGVVALAVAAGAGVWWATADSGEPAAGGPEARRSSPPVVGPAAPSASGSPSSPGPPPSASGSPSSPGTPPNPDNCRYKKVKPKPKPTAPPSPSDDPYGRGGPDDPDGRSGPGGPGDPYGPGGPGDPLGPGGPGDPYGPGGQGAPDEEGKAPAAQPEPKPRFVGRPPKAIDTGKTYVATITTNHGDLILKLDVKHAPCTVNSFVFLARKGFFDDSRCPRMIAGRIVGALECGDRVGPGYTFADENLSGARYTRGMLAMANSGKNTNGSALFVFFKDSQYPPQYTPFARITGGSKTLAKIAKAAEPYDDYAPPGAVDSKVTIKKVKITVV